MRIGLFTTMAGRQAAGPETYEVSLLQALGELETAHRFEIFCLGDRARASLDHGSSSVHFHTLRPRSRWLSIPFGLPWAVNRVKPDVLHATLTAPPFPGVPLVFTVHDLTMFQNPEFYRPLVRLRLQQAIRPAIRKARVLLCISAFVRDQLQSYFDIEPERLAVVHHGVHARFQPVTGARQILLRELALEGPYLLFTGQMKLRKNIFRLLEAFAILRSRGFEVKLVLAGRRGDTTEGMDDILRRLCLEPHVRELGHVPDCLLPALYSQAEAFIFPSLQEGFGLPVLEAMACGTPVLTSQVSALPEVAGDAALLVDPFSVEAIADGMQQLVASSTLRCRLRAAGLARARQFTWQTCARRTLAAYERAFA